MVTTAEMTIMSKAGAVLVSVVAAVWDVRESRIPNALTLPALSIALLLHLLGGGWKEGISALLGCLLAGGVFLVFHVAGGMGAGDVKLMAAVGAFAGLSATPIILFATSIFGGVMAFSIALARGKFKATASNISAIVKHHSSLGIDPHPHLNVRNKASLRMPYGVAIASGAIYAALSLPIGSF